MPSGLLVKDLNIDRLQPIVRHNNQTEIMYLTTSTHFHSIIRREIHWKILINRYYCYKDCTVYTHGSNTIIYMFLGILQNYLCSCSLVGYEGLFPGFQRTLERYEQFLYTPHHLGLMKRGSKSSHYVKALPNIDTYKYSGTMVLQDKNESISRLHYTSSGNG